MLWLSNNNNYYSELVKSAEWSWPTVWQSVLSRTNADRHTSHATNSTINVAYVWASWWHDIKGYKEEVGVDGRVKYNTLLPPNHDSLLNLSSYPNLLSSGPMYGDAEELTLGKA